MLDLILFALISVSALFGLIRGLIGVLASMVAWLLAGWAAFRFGGTVALQFVDGPQPTATELFGGYALCFLAVLVFVGVVGWVVRRLVHGIGLSGVDRLLGGALGALRGVFVACVLLLLLGFTHVPQEVAWQRSQLVPLLLPGAQWLRGWLPEWAAAQADFGNGTRAGDNRRQIDLPIPLDEGVPQTDSPSS
ncbi:CvpA family protein [Pseudoxanthomonas helianthi]|uniref:CvpA family protein n=1 Tax=Pseudoxanthomonas helianthi TaxID=1453541 RepID=A0A940X1A2_9GAMM|nr:CvpA family protein [Pseudoxanthomonas helianthi]MBP3982864.1 CvpA family protein [Pseudoxanthomonas helianthi]